MMEARKEMMKRVTITILILAVCCLGQQTSAAEPTKPPELKVLERFVGTWDCEVVMKPAIWMPDEKREKSMEVNEMSLDGWFLHGSSKTTAGKTKAILMNTYDPAQKNYRIWQFMPGGSCEEMRGKWDEAASTLTITTDLGDGITRKAAFHLIDQDRRACHIVWKDGGGKVYLDVQGDGDSQKATKW